MKINWFSRLFMKWSKIEKIIKNEIESKLSNNIDELENKSLRLSVEKKALENQIILINNKNSETLKSKEELLMSLIEQKNKLENTIDSYQKESYKLKQDQINIEKRNGEYKSEIKETIGKKDTKIEILGIEINNLKEKISNYKIDIEKLKNSNNKSDGYNIKHQETIKNRAEEIIKLKTSLDHIMNERQSLEQNIITKLAPLQKINKTFFDSSGNKGKGNMAELQLKRLLESSDLDKELWIENLQVGQKVVEFAIRGEAENEKWIPVDSKALDYEKDEEENEIIINSQFINKLRSQAKKISEYLNKKNTASYGLLVLQNDAIYTQIFEHDKTIFNKIIKEYKIYISSPSSFIQFAQSISHIIELYSKVKKTSELFDSIIKLSTNINNFGSNMHSTYKHFKLAMEKHYPIIQKQENDVKDQYLKNIGNKKPLKLLIEK